MQRSYMTVISKFMETIENNHWQRFKVITKHNINDRIVTDSRVIANGLINYFISIGPHLANYIACSVNPLSYVKSIDYSIVIVNNVLLRSRTSHILTD